MVDIDIVDTTIRATGAGGNRAAVETTGWDWPADGLELPASVDASVSGRASALTLPWLHTWIWRIEDGRRTFDSKLTDERVDRRLESDSYLVVFDDSIQTMVAFDGEATIERSPDHDVTISFPRPTAVTIGFQSWVNRPEHTVTVPRTTAGVARALEAFAVARRVSTTTLTSPTSRGHPPRVRFGDESIPEAVRESIGETGVELRVPDRLEAVVPLTSLAFYLGATVTVADGAEPSLRIPAADFEHPLGSMPRLQHEAAALLERVFQLDNLLRLTVQEADLAERDAFARLDLDHDRLYDAPVTDRLLAYLDPDLAYETLEAVLPPWHYTAYVEPSFEYVPALPSIAHRLGRVFVPECAGRSGRVGPTPGEADDGHDGSTGPFTGWLASGTPRGPFLGRPAAYENRSPPDGGNSPERVAVVGSDDRRSSDLESVLDCYRDRPAYPDEIDVIERPSVGDLRGLFADGAAFVHYVGDVDDGAFVCRDGALSPDDVPDCAARALFLDAPSSLSAAIELVDRGATAAVARRCDDGLPAETRRILLELLGGGFAVDHAVRFVRRYAEATDALVAVGDGLAQVGQVPDMYVLPYLVEAVGDGRFAVTGDIQYPNAGLLWSADVPGARAHLVGNPGEMVVDAAEIRTLVSSTASGIIVADGGIYWADELEPFYPAA